MSRSHPARTAARRIQTVIVAGLLVVIAGTSAALGIQLLAPSASAISSPSPALRSEHRGGLNQAEGIRPMGIVPLASDHIGAIGESDGLVPDGTTVFDDDLSGVANLDPDLLAALRQAAADGSVDGVVISIDSGWRSAAYQDQLLREAVTMYGSEAEAARWVATADTSPHVSGDAVDIGDADALTWLSAHGARYGLCQIYRNEPWHYELRPGAAAQGCPEMYADPTRDPRMRR